MTDPKKLAEEWLKDVLEKANSNPLTYYDELLLPKEALPENAFLAGYQSRDTEVADLKARLEASVRVIINCQEIAFAPNVNYSLRQEALLMIEEEMKHG